MPLRHFRLYIFNKSQWHKIDNHLPIFPDVIGAMLAASAPQSGACHCAIALPLKHKLKPPARATQTRQTSGFFRRATGWRKRAIGRAIEKIVENPVEFQPELPLYLSGLDCVGFADGRCCSEIPRAASYALPYFWR